METQRSSASRFAKNARRRGTPAERWNVGHRIRDVECAPDGRSLECSKMRILAGCSRVTPK
jgi:hypothetical protein